MAEPATTAASTAAGHERDAPLATKLHLPRPRPRLVARPRLLQRLNEGMGRELVLICTPVGFGKTTLLAEWARNGQRPLPLARLRARGQLVELREADLRFTGEEAAALLRSAVGADLPEAAVAALEDRTEGWAAGLQLAALSLRGCGDVDTFVAG